MNHYKEIYGDDLELKLVNTCPRQANILDLNINVKANKFHVDLYDKRRDFDFTITNFPHFTSNLSRNLFNNVITSQLSRYADICSNRNDLIKNCKLLINNLRQRDYPTRFFKIIFTSFLNRHIYKRFGLNVPAKDIWNSIK